MNRIEVCKNFRKLLTQKCVAIPGAFNGLVARSCLKNGFESLYVSGGAISAKSGVPDIGLLSLDNFCKVIKEVSDSTGLPIIADADTGFGEGEMVNKTVWEYFMSGACGLHIEDQVFPKKCGHLDNKQLIKAEDFANKVRLASLASQKCSNGEFIICARTDAFNLFGMEEAIRRSKLYIDSGASMIFPEGLKTKEDFDLLSKELRSYKKDILLLANMTEFGKTDYISLEEFEKMGYNCVIYPVSTLRVAMKAVDMFLKDLKSNGTQKNYLDNMQSRKELYELLDYKNGEEWLFPRKEAN